MHLADQSETRAAAAAPVAKLSLWLHAARTATARLIRAPAVVRADAAPGDPDAKPWAQTLGQVIADLDRLDQETERDFLRIGAKLAEFIEAVDLISSQLTGLADLVSGEHGLRASQALSDALNRCMEISARQEDRQTGLSGLRQEAGKLKQTLSGFEGTVATFRTLGVLTRIETARLGSAGADFGNLADDVKALATDVQARVETALATAGLLIPPIQNAANNLAAVGAGQAKDLPAVIAELLASLAAFCGIQTRAHDSSARMAAHYREISGAFKKLIVAIQFHDITRQQVEHVIRALRSVHSLPEEGVSADRRGAAAAVLLQASQLADAQTKFAESVASVTQNLDEIAGRVSQMAEESRMLSGLSEDEKNSFFLEMEKGCTAILGRLSHCAEATAATRDTSVGLVHTIDRMRGSIEEIQAIEIQMQRMALNAAIRAAHIGPLGDALSVLAGAMQQGAFESRRCSESLVDALASMSQSAANLFRQGGSAGDLAGEDRSVESMRKAVAELHSSSEQSFARIARITACGARLREDISATCGSFSVGSRFAGVVGRAREMLAAIGNGDQAGFPPEGDENLERSLAGFARHYTMQAERDVHEGAAKAVVGPALGEAEVPTSQSSEEWGGNVEFF